MYQYLHRSKLKRQNSLAGTTMHFINILNAVVVTLYWYTSQVEFVYTSTIRTIQYFINIDSFQIIDHLDLTPVRQTELGYPTEGFCITRQWLVIVRAHWAQPALDVYSLPDLKFRDSTQTGGWWPRADNDNMVYLPFGNNISMFQINSSGGISLLGSFTLPRKLPGWANVAVGPRVGQLIVGASLSCRVCIISTTNSSMILRTLKWPRKLGWLQSMATGGNGQILVGTVKGMVLYKSPAHQPVLLTDAPVYGGLGIICHGNQFLACERSGSRLFVVDADGTWHTVNALNGQDGVWLTNIRDVAVWDNCVFVTDIHTTLVLLCPI